MNIIEHRQDPKSTVPPERWMEMAIYGWESPGWGSERAVVHHTGVGGPSATAIAEIEDSFSRTFGLPAI